MISAVFQRDYSSYWVENRSEVVGKTGHGEANPKMAAEIKARFNKG